MSGSGSRTPFSPTPASSATRTRSTPSPTSARRRASRAAAGPRVRRLSGAPGGTSTSVIAATSSPASVASPSDPRPALVEAEEAERIVVEDLAAHGLVEPPLPGPPPLLVVVVGDHREVRAEQHAVLVAQQVGVADRGGIGARVG